MKLIYEKLVKINPLLENKHKGEIDLLVDELKSWGFEWSEERNTFYNQELCRGIFPDKLGNLDVSDLRELLSQIHVRQYLRIKKTRMWTGIAILLSMLSFFFFDWKLSLLIVLAVVVTANLVVRFLLKYRI